jgi:hypothetical protein
MPDGFLRRGDVVARLHADWLGVALMLRVGRDGFGSESRRFRGDGIVAVPLGLGAVYLKLAYLERVHLEIGRRGRPRRRPLLIGLAARVGDAEIVLGVLVQIFGSNTVVTDCRFPREGDVTLEDLVGAPADLDVGAVAVECMIALRNSRLPLDRPVSVKATARPLI